MRRSFLFLVLLFSLSAVHSADFMSISVDDIRVNVPPGWLAQYTQTPVVFYLYSPLEQNDTFQENCNLTIEKLFSELTIDEYKNLAGDQLKNLYSDFQFLEKGENFHIYSGNYNDIVLKQMQYFTMEKDTVYILTFTALPETFEKYEYQFRNIAESFEVTRPGS